MVGLGRLAIRARAEGVVHHAVAAAAGYEELEAGLGEAGVVKEGKEGADVVRVRRYKDDFGARLLDFEDALGEGGERRRGLEDFREASGDGIGGVIELGFLEGGGGEGKNVLVLAYPGNVAPRCTRVDEVGERGSYVSVGGDRS